MRTVIVVLRVFGTVWFGLVVLTILVGQAAILYFEGFRRWQEVMSPFNVANYIVTITLLAPAMASWWCADRLTSRRRQREAAARTPQQPA